MQRKMIDVFERHLRGWVHAWSENPKFREQRADADELLRELYARLPASVFAKFGAALDRKLLVVDPKPGRGYFVGADGDSSHCMLTRQGDRIAPCWEMFVHLAECGALLAACAVDERLTVGIEDELMDLTVRREGQLVANIEVKTGRRQAEDLIRDMKARAGKPVPEKAEDSNDGAKKLRYLIRAKPPGPVLFSVRAADVDAPRPVFEENFVAHVDADARIVTLEEATESILLRLELQYGADPTARAHAIFAWALERELPDVWAMRGRSGTHLVYRTRDDGDRILLGAQRTDTDGRLYTDLGALSRIEIGALEQALGREGLGLGDTSSSEQHRTWKRLDGSGFVPDEDFAHRFSKTLLAVLKGE